MTIEKQTHQHPQQKSAPVETPASVEIYRPFFLAGILTVLTAGCTLGAIALAGLCLRGNYVTTAWTPYVLAHANSQLYGWVGFFIMGFALQMHPPKASAIKLFRILSVLSLTFMAVGISLRFIADPLASANGSYWTTLGVLSAVCQTVSVGLFMVNNTVTRYASGEKLSWQTKFVFASLAWMTLIAIAEPYVFWMAHQAPETSILFVAEWFSPLREAQFLGFVANMIFGVALVKLHTCFGAQEANRELGNAAFLGWNFGVVLRMVGWVTYFRAGMSEDAIRFYVTSGTVLAISATCFVLSSRMFEKTSIRVPSHKFIRASFVWLLISGALMILEPVHLRQTSLPFSHAYIGGIRHALTVGFISQMIIGISSHVVAKMNDIPDSLQKSFLLTFWLLNIGNAGRVFLEIATDYTPRAFGPMGFTGFIELTGLVLWGAAMVRIMLVGRAASIRHQNRLQVA